MKMDIEMEIDDNSHNNGRGRGREYARIRKYATYCACFNIGLALSTFLFSLIIMLYGVYWKLDNAQEILLSSIGVVFILEVDDWIGAWFRGHYSHVQHQELTLVLVDHESYLSQFRYFQWAFAVLLALLVFLVWMCAADLYEMIAQEGEIETFPVLFGLYVASQLFAWLIAVQLLGDDNLLKRMSMRVVVMGLWFTVGLFLIVRTCVRTYGIIEGAFEGSSTLAIIGLALFMLSVSWPTFALLWYWKQPIYDPALFPTSLQKFGKLDLGQQMWCVCLGLEFIAVCWLRIVHWEYVQSFIGFAASVFLICWRFGFIHAMFKNYSAREADIYQRRLTVQDYCSVMTSKCCSKK